ncbi:MAG: LptE family protein [Phycisphaerae bacterium]|nr:LptE family protein [Phycisphaerae bacterium]
MPQIPATIPVTARIRWMGVTALALGLCCGTPGCRSCAGYSGESLFPSGIRTLCLQMFDNRTFRRDVEYDLSTALAKRIESDTPYKIVSDPDRADSLISGQILSINESVITLERQTGSAMEKEMQITAVVNWKDLRSSELLLNSQTVTASATYSDFMQQGSLYASKLAANRLAERIVRAMETTW